MLEIKRLALRYDDLKILSEISIAFPTGQITGLIGPNGAGKTSLFDCVTNFVRSWEGDVVLDGVSIRRKATHQIARLGLSRTFQTPRLFSSLTALENLVVAASPAGVFDYALNSVVSQRAAKLQDRLIRVGEECLEFVGLDAKRDTLASDLSGGQQKLLELARALAVDPKVMLLDEPVAGVSPALASELAEVIRNLTLRGIGVVLIEHNMDFVMRLSERLVVLAQGSVIADGAPDSVRAEPKVLDAYLGGGEYVTGS